MEHYHILNGIGIMTMILAAAMAAFRFGLLDRAARWIAVLLVLGAVTELVAYASASIWRNNMPVYAIFNMLEVVLVSIFYSELIPGLKKQRRFWYIIVGLMAIGILNLSFFQSIWVSNSNFMVIGAAYIIAVSSLLILRSLGQGGDRMGMHVWLNMVLVFYWALSLMSWLVYDHMDSIFGQTDIRVVFVIHVLNWLTNLFFATIFFLTPNFNRYG